MLRLTRLSLCLALIIYILHWKVGEKKSREIKRLRSDSYTSSSGSLFTQRTLITTVTSWFKFNQSALHMTKVTRVASAWLFKKNVRIT